MKQLPLFGEAQKEEVWVEPKTPPNINTWRKYFEKLKIEVEERPSLADLLIHVDSLPQPKGLKYYLQYKYKGKKSQ